MAVACLECFLDIVGSRHESRKLLPAIGRGCDNVTLDDFLAMIHCSRAAQLCAHSSGYSLNAVWAYCLDVRHAVR